MNLRALCFCLASCMLIGCPDSSHTPKSPPAEPQPVEPGPTLSKGSSPQARAKGAAKALGTQLKTQLKMALDKDGFTGGITACKIAAPSIAKTVSARQGVKVGRTSFKLRNPANAPPAWAKAQVEAQVSEPSFAESEDGTLKALLPIKLEPLCVACHGQADALSAEVKQALAKDYPEDQATGFEPGDLRGYFWVEVPPQ